MARIDELNARLAAFDLVRSGGPAPGPALSFGSVWAGLTAPTTLPSEGIDVTVHPSAGLVAPLPGARLTQGFGPSSLSLEPTAVVDGTRYDHYHDGLDLAAPIGRPVLAAADGTVVSAGRMPDGAVAVRIRHADESETFYAHLEADLEVRTGDSVKAGQAIGTVGMTGNTTGPHLHFELRFKGRTVDPAPWLEAGRLPGADALAAHPDVASTPDALARFDAVANDIPFAVEIRSAAIEAGIDPLLLASMIRAESGFRPEAVSWAGAQGLTQLMPGTARSLEVSDPFDPAENVRGGAKYLAGNLRIYGRVDLALAAYQAGKGAVARAGGIPESPTTHRYIDRILSYWAGYLEKSS
jgi:hypothetical protein